MAGWDMSPEEVRARFKWAFDQGHPVWLWPETSPEQWQSALLAIARAISGVLAGSPQHLAFDGNAEDFGIAAFTSGTGPLLGYWAASGLLDTPPALAAVLKCHLAHNSDRMERLEAIAVAAVEALSRAGVRVTVLKGMHTAHRYFPVPGSRPLSDIDLLIEGSAWPTASRTLNALGYRPEAPGVGEQTWRMNNTPSQPHSLSLVHRDNPWSIDLHTSLDRKYSPGAPTIHLDRALQFHSRERWSLSPSGEVLAGVDLLHHLASHASLGFTSLSLLRLTELVFVIRRLEEDNCLSWDDFLESTSCTGIPGNCYPALHQTNLLAPGTVPPAVLEALARQTPTAVRRVVAALTPATCHGVLRFSLSERFMWTRSFLGWVREAGGSLLPPGNLRRLADIYRMRCARLLGGMVTR